MITDRADGVSFTFSDPDFPAIIFTTESGRTVVINLRVFANRLDRHLQRDILNQWIDEQSTKPVPACAGSTEVKGTPQVSKKWQNAQPSADLSSNLKIREETK